MNNETQIGVTFNNQVKNLDQLEKYEERLKNIYGFLGGVNSSNVKEAMQEINKNTKEITKNTKDAKIQTSKFSKGLKTAFNIGSLALFNKALQSLSKTFFQLSQKSTEYIENVNLLEVAYKNSSETIEQSSARIEEYIQKMSDVYGLDESRLTRQFGIFKQLANAMQLPTETAENLSEIMVKMTNDIASLYNLDLNRASNALQSALAGQVRPIRSATGADITEKTLQNTVTDLGLDRSISQLSYVEKRLIMVISLTNQLKVSQGDYARTIESASNQIRVMHEQWDRLSRAVGNVFYPILEKILPYINAVLMALTEIFNMLASLFGFKMPEFDYSGLVGVSDLAQDIEDEMVGAGDATDELASKLKGLRSFDKLNVINTPSASKTSAIGGGSGYVDPTIMDAFNKAFSEYDDKLESVRMKASKIKDDIMRWLGFEKELNEETGKIEWKYKGLGTTLKNMWKSFKNLNPLVKTFVGYLALMGAVKIYKGIKNLIETITSSTLGKSLHDIVSYAQIYTKLSGSKTQGILSGVDAWARNATAVEKFQMRLTGATGVIVSMGLTYDAMKKINDEGINLKNSMELLGGTMSGVLGGAMFGSTFGGWGAVIGAVSGAIVDLGMVLIAYETDMDKIVNKAKESLAEVEKTATETTEHIKETEMEIASEMYETNYHEQLLDELNQIMDANGKIKEGYEDRANFILNELGSAYGVEYELIDGVLQNSNEVTQSIKDQIALKEQQILLEAYEKDYIWALGRKNELMAQLNEAEENRNSTIQEMNSLLSGTGVTMEEYIDLLEKEKQGVKLSREEQEKINKVEEKMMRDDFVGSRLRANMKALEKNNEAVDKATKNYQNNADLIAKYSDFQTAVLTGDMEKVNSARDEYTKTYVKDNEIMTLSDEESTKQRILDYETDLKRWKETNDERYKNYKDSLTDIKNYTDGVTPEITQQWMALGQTSSEDFIKEFSKLPDDIQKEIVSQMYQQGVNINDELQRGLDSFEVTKTVKTKVDNSKLKESYQGIADVFSQIGFKAMADQYYTMASRIPQYASGGLPPVGQLFVANERGAELVGHIGGQSFVANQNQMMDLLDKKIGTAQSQKQVFNIYLDADHKIGTYTLDQLESLAKTNGQAITIGG